MRISLSWPSVHTGTILNFALYGPTEYFEELQLYRKAKLLDLHTLFLFQRLILFREIVRGLRTIAIAEDGSHITRYQHLRIE